MLTFLVDFGCGGTERQAVTLAEALDDVGWDVRFGCLKRAGHFLDALDRRGIAVREYPIATLRRPRALAQAARLTRDLAREKTDIVHAYNFYGNVFAVPAARLAGVPVVIAAIRDRGAYLSPAQLAVQRQVCRLADCVLVNAYAIKSWLVDQGYDAGRIAVIPNGLDLSMVWREGAARADLGRTFGLSADAPLVGVVGRISPTKGIEDAIDAAAIVGLRHPAARLVIVGEASELVHGQVVEDRAYLERLAARARRLGLGDRVIFTGYRADVPAILAELTVSVQPSHSEGLSNVILESMAAGCPVVATSVGGTPEAITDGITGLLVPPAGPRGLAAAISTMLDDPARARRLGEEGQRRVSADFSLSRMTRATQDLYIDLLRRKGVARGRPDVRADRAGATVPAALAAPWGER